MFQENHQPDSHPLVNWISRDPLSPHGSTAPPVGKFPLKRSSKCSRSSLATSTLIRFSSSHARRGTRTVRRSWKATPFFIAGGYGMGMEWLWNGYGMVRKRIIPDYVAFQKLLGTYPKSQHWKEAATKGIFDRQESEYLGLCPNIFFLPVSIMFAVQHRVQNPNLDLWRTVQSTDRTSRRMKDLPEKVERTLSKTKTSLPLD